MPQQHYEYRPTEEVWTFRELMHHIAYGIHWWEEQFVKGKETAWDPPPVKKDRAAVLTYLKGAFDSLEKTVKGGKRDGVHATLDHVTHHRGAATIYLRAKGITPPEYQY